MPEVSIIVPVYNVEKYVCDCIDSILSQTYQCFELILVDDGSADKSGEICDSYQKEHQNIKVLHQDNQGQAAARNNGVKLSEAEWILFIDSDDIIHPQLLEFLMRAAKESKADISASRRVMGDSLSDEFFKNRNFDYQTLSINEDTLLELYKNTDSDLSEIYWLIYPKLIRASIVKKYPFFEGKIFEDNEVACKWLVEAGKVSVLSEKMYFYTDNPTGTMRKKFNPKKLDYLWALERQIDFYRSIGYQKMYKAVAEGYFGDAVHMCKCVERELKDINLCKQLMKRTEKNYRNYSKYCKLNIDSYIKNYIFKYAHPIKYKLTKLTKLTKK